MMGIESKQVHQNFSFFNAVERAKETCIMPRILVDLGGNGDCGFRAVAAGLIDNTLTAHPHLDSKLLKKILDRHFKYFPDDDHAIHYLTVTERIKKLNRDPLFVQSLAFTLRQIAVDELCAHPVHYRGAFVEKNEATDPATMRKPRTWIDESCIAALATALSMPIDVHVVANGKSSPLQLHYHSVQKNETNATLPPIVIQLNNGHYCALLTAPINGATKVNATKPSDPLPIAETNRDLDSIKAEIAVYDKQVASTFERIRDDKLTVMVLAGDLTKDDLIALYIKGMGTSDYLQGRIKYAGMEQGNEDFFNTIYKQPTAPNLSLTREQQLISELIHGIARAISIGQMDEETVFAYLDSPKGPTRS